LLFLLKVTDRAGFLVRQYIKDSLYDRMSTRPFLTQTEKKWIAFQLLLAIQQAHKHGVRPD
jgi:phosphoinositide-3-kinase regulatory subunit 4